MVAGVKSGISGHGINLPFGIHKGDMTVAFKFLEGLFLAEGVMTVFSASPAEYANHPSANKWTNRNAVINGFKLLAEAGFFTLEGDTLVPTERLLNHFF